MTKTQKQLIENVEKERKFLEGKLQDLIRNIGMIPIANKQLMPFGWRKAAKGRTVWRIVEEIISQNIEKQAKELGFEDASPADSEVGVYDFEFSYQKGKKSYVNIKSSVKDGKKSKDDISKAEGLIAFYDENPNANLYVATFIIGFNYDKQKNPFIKLEDCIVFPTAWIPDVYVNPSNNGNLQSSEYKSINKAVKRTPQQFLDCLIIANNEAIKKRKRKKTKKTNS